MEETTLEMEFLAESFSQDNYSIGFANISLGVEEESLKDLLLNSSGKALTRFPAEDKEYIFDRLFVRAIFITVYTIVFCSCFFGNLLVILLVTLHWRMRSITNFCLANLAFANLCVGVFCVYQNLSTYLITSWVFGDFMCKMYHFINSLSYTASILILVVICIERYLAIIHPIRCRQILTINRLRASIVAVWIVSAIYCSPRLYYITTITIPRRDGEIETLCIPKRTLYDSATFDVINFLLMFLVPLLVISVLYTMIGITLWKSSHNQMPAPSSTSLSDSVGGETSSQFFQNGHTHRDKSLGCRERNPLVILSRLGGKDRARHAGTRVTSSFYSSCCCKKRRECPEWALYADSTSIKTTKTSRPSLILTDAQDIDHVLLDGEDSIMHTTTPEPSQNPIPNISVTVDTNHVHSNRNISGNTRHVPGSFVEANEHKLTLSSVRNKRREKLRKQSKIEELCSKSKPNKEDSQDSSGVFYKTNKKNPASEKKGSVFRFGSRVTALSQNNRSKYRVCRNASNSSNGETENGILRLNSSKEMSICSEDIPLEDFRRAESSSGSTIPALRRTGAMKANRIGAQALNSRRRVIRMLIVIVVTFAICNLPFHGRKLWQIWSSSYRGGSVFSTLFTPITFLIMYANCAINPILYVFMSANFRQSFRDLLCCRLKHKMDTKHRRVRGEAVFTSASAGASNVISPSN